MHTLVGALPRRGDRRTEADDVENPSASRDQPTFGVTGHAGTEHERVVEVLDGLESVDDRAGARSLGIAGGRAHDTHGGVLDERRRTTAEITICGGDQQVDEQVLSAHRTPDKVAAFARSARDAGFAAIICGAGMAAHLAGAVAAQTTLPVVGVPLSGGALNGIDALYATVQMPRGIPVATVAVDGAMNAALLVVQMLAISDASLAAQLEADRRERSSQ